MDPITLAAISAGGSLLQGLLGNAAQKEQQKKQLELQGQMQGLQTQSGAIQSGAQAQQRGLQSLIDSYRGVLL